MVVLWSWQLAMFIGFLWLVVRLDRRHRPEFRYRLWTFALVMSLAPSVGITGGSRPFMDDASQGSLDRNSRRLLWAIKGNNRRRPRVIETGSNVSTFRYPGDEVAHSSLLAELSSVRILGLFWILGVAVGGAREIRGHRRMQTIVDARAPLSGAVIRLRHPAFA